MKSVYILGISLAIGVVILYIQWQQKKKLEEMNTLLTNIQLPQQQQNTLDREFIVEENQRLHRKIESAYDKVHQQYQQILIAVDNIPVIGNDESMEDDSENIRSYHGEQLIDIEENNKEYNSSLDEVPMESILGLDNRSINSKIDNSTNNDKSFTEPNLEGNNNSLGQKAKSENNETTANLVSIQSENTNYPKISELKNLCKERGLIVSGNKTDLVQRLLDSGYIF
jgi:hypothetical protein